MERLFVFVQAMICLTDRGNHPRRSAHCVWLWAAVMAIACGGAIVGSGRYAFAQPAGEAVAIDDEEAEAEDTRPLYQREPFDLIKLDEANAGEVIKVVPVKRPLPKNPSPTATLEFSRFDQRNRKYQVPWRNIVEVKLFESMLVEEAQRLTNEKQYDEAYRFLEHVMNYYPQHPGLQEAVNEFLLNNAVEAFRQKKYIEVFSMLEELHQNSPKFRTETVLRGFDQAANALLKHHMDEGNIVAAQMLLTRLESSYSDKQVTAIANWRGQLSSMAAVKRDAAKKALTDQNMREAYKLVQEMLHIYPNVPGGPELGQQVANTYPLVYVGVTQPAADYEPNQIENWASRRAGRLVSRMLLEFRQPGAEGGEYAFPLGTITLSEDRQQLMLRVNSKINGVTAPLTGFEVSRRLIDLATIGNSDYTPSWASLVSGVQVSNVFDVYADFRRPHVLPQAMLLTRFSDQVSSPESMDGSGSYYLGGKAENEQQFLLKPNDPFARPGQPKEIVERYFASAEEAKQALMRGDIDVLDQLYPADAAKLRSRSDLEVRQYAMPQVHVLVPVSDHPYLENRNFRRALVYAINREGILKQELLNQEEVPGCQVISGPFPAGRNEVDPLGYAYDSTIRPLPYNPRLAFALALTSQFEIKTLAEKKGEKIGDMIEGIPMPEDPDMTDEERKLMEEEAAKAKPVPPAKALVIGHPATELARVACQAIQQQLTSVKIRCSLKELPLGLTHDPENKCDLLYVTAAVWEPIVDARRLLGPDGLAQSNNPYINLQLRKLESARSWKDVRDALHDLHSRVAGEMTVLPLWQTVDHYAYRKSVRGIGDRPVSLYQDVEQWSISPQVKTN
ncbi:MAG: hypothetical protein KDA71_21940 [Planctomycetales bacterium]|nr:hypothetical protein [Planctomycetales bacterium]